MPYFADHDSALTLPAARTYAPGFRNSQLGAIYAVASYFTLHPRPGSGEPALRPADPALVVMPTGSGKTAVLLACAFMLRPQRGVLIVTPSRSVRNQITGEARKLATLKKIGAVPEDLPTPEVCEVEHRLTTKRAWRGLARFDVVVGTPNSLSPGSYGVAGPPAAPLFDLVLMDEAHHSPARTWSALLAAFPAAQKVLCTATPFRRDEREIRAHTVYEYPLSQALKDEIICNLDYVPVTVGRGQDPDEALARRAAEMLRKEQKKNPSYRLMARTDRKTHTKKLEPLYEQAGLRLKTVHSGYSQRYIDQTLKKLRETDDLDGLLCVDMLGEGFDFPTLKVGVIHRKHKSLPVTLQFVGRFGRVTGHPEEMARILAVPEELEGSIERLYAESSAWAELMPNLHKKRIEKDRAIKRDLANFKVATDLPEQLRETSLWGLKPLAHVKIYEVDDDAEVSIDRAIELERPFELVYRAVSDELSTALFLSRELRRPSWATSDVTLFNGVEYDLFVVHWNADSKLLFISASRRGSIALYEQIARQYTGQSDDPESTRRHSILPLYKINRVLRGHPNANCFNLGMRNRQVSLVNENYRILAGPEVQRAVHFSDGRLFHRGHVMIGVEDPSAERTVTLGYSSASKVWRSKYLRVPRLVEWCHQIAAQIADNSEVRVHENLRNLPVGEKLETLPDNIMAANWDDDVYLRSMWLEYRATGKPPGSRRKCELLEAAWRVKPKKAEAKHVDLVLEAAHGSWAVRFSLTASRLFTAPDPRKLPRVRTHDEEMKLLDYLNASPLHLYTADFSRLHGPAIFRAPEHRTADGERWEMFDRRSFQTRDWMADGVRLDREFGWTGAPYTREGFDRESIHGRLADLLEEEGFAGILYDHGTGEIADFVTWEEKRRGEPLRWWTGREERDSVHVYLFHVKGAKKGKKQPVAKPGNRVGDAYEVCGQVVKSLIWVPYRRKLADRLAGRCKKSSFFLRGDVETAQALLTQRRRPVYFHIGLVQPGITASGAADRIREVLAATDDYVRNAIGSPVFVFCSP